MQLLLVRVVRIPPLGTTYWGKKQPESPAPLEGEGGRGGKEEKKKKKKQEEVNLQASVAVM